MIINIDYFSSKAMGVVEGFRIVRSSAVRVIKNMQYPFRELKALGVDRLAVDGNGLLHTKMQSASITDVRQIGGGGGGYSDQTIRALEEYMNQAKANGVELVIIFDNPIGNVHKSFEQNKRQTTRKNTRKKLNDDKQRLAAMQSQSIFDTDIDGMLRLEAKIKKTEKASLVPHNTMFIKFQELLTQRNIPWIVSPRDVEGEQIAALLTAFKSKDPLHTMRVKSAFGPMCADIDWDEQVHSFEQMKERWEHILGCDCVHSGDSDCIAFGASALFRVAQVKHPETGAVKYQGQYVNLDENCTYGPISEEGRCMSPKLAVTALMSAFRNDFRTKKVITRMNNLPWFGARQELHGDPLMCNLGVTPLHGLVDEHLISPIYENRALPKSKLELPKDPKKRAEKEAAIKKDSEEIKQDFLRTLKIFTTVPKAIGQIHCI